MRSLKSVGTLAGLEPLREKIESLTTERKEVAGLPVSHDEARARVTEHVKAIAHGVRDGHHPAQTKEHWFTHRHFMPGRQPQTDFSSVEQALAIVAPDGLREFLLERLEAVLVDAPPGIATAEREQQLEKLDAEILKLGVEEEVAICAFEESGLDMDRRGDADPSIVLECEFDDSEPREAA